MKTLSNCLLCSRLRNENVIMLEHEVYRENVFINVLGAVNFHKLNKMQSGTELYKSVFSTKCLIPLLPLLPMQFNSNSAVMCAMNKRLLIKGKILSSLHRSAQETKAVG